MVAFLSTFLETSLLVSVLAIQCRTGDSQPSMHQNATFLFSEFIAHDDSMTCTSRGSKKERMFNNQIRGVNLGGWMVLEPWITPSLFYQFLGGDEQTTAFDTYSFCEVLKEEANVQLRRHWDKWVTEEIVQQLAASGAVNSLRLPIGDFQFIPYGPYEKYNCWDGSLEYVDSLLDWAYSYGLTVLLDIHTMKGSQNGFDNSGQTVGFKWTSALNREFANQLSFEHWPIRTAGWIGEFDPEEVAYTSINKANIEHSLKVIQKIVDRYSGHPAILGLEPVNEPWEHTPIEVLKRFYWEGYKIVKHGAPYWKYVMHDSFHLDPSIWGGFMANCPERILDTHIYQAWRNPSSRTSFYADACNAKSALAALERDFGPVVVGEWSLATDNCAMWLNGFNDNLPGFPRLPCKYTKCRPSYLGTEQPGVPLDPAKPLQGPYGTGMSGPIFGLCPSTRDWLKESEDHPLTGRDYIKAPPEAPKHLDATDEVMASLTLKKLDAFSRVAHGYYFWNFRTDLYDPQWSYMEALERGWIPKGPLNINPDVASSCVREDSGEYHCTLKRGQLDASIMGALGYIYNVEGKEESDEALLAQNLTGHELHEFARQTISDFYDNNHAKGATCDFGGIAMLVEHNRTIDTDLVEFTDDDFFGYMVVQEEGPSWYMLVGIGALIAVFASMAGFIAAMRLSPGFNRHITSSTVLKPLVEAGAQSKLLRKSLNLPMMMDYDTLQEVDQEYQNRK